MGKYTAADIVHFVKFDDFKEDPAKLALEILKKIPSICESWFRKNKITPYDKAPEPSDPTYFASSKESFLKKEFDGEDLKKAKDFLDKQQIWAADKSLVEKLLKEENFVNPLLI